MFDEQSIARDVAAIGRIDAVPAILKAVANITGMRLTAVARVTDARWIACAVQDDIAFGLAPGGELVLETTICDEIRHSGQAVMFGQASLHPVYATHKTPALYGFESYVSVPILRQDGSFFGTLCAIDPLPAKLDDPQILETLQLFAQLIGSQLDLQDRLVVSDEALLAAQDLARLREQFIAVLGHDLRNPLQAISMASEMILLDEPTPRVARNLGRIQDSVARMSALIQDVLDFARGRLGGGIPVALHADDDLAGDLRQVLDEARLNHPQRSIESVIELDLPVICDCRRIAQLLDNLVANALHHGDSSLPVEVNARSDRSGFTLSVRNQGTPIAAEKRERLFQPFSRRGGDEPGPGLGLGLYIAAEIAKAHAGTLTVDSTDSEGTCFTFHMPAA